MHTTFLNKNGFGTTSTFPTSADQSCHLFQTLPIQGKHGKHGKHGTIPVMFIYPKSGRSRHLSTFHISHGSICLKPLAVPQANARTPMLFLGKAMKSRMVVCEITKGKPTKLGAAFHRFQQQCGDTKPREVMTQPRTPCTIYLEKIQLEP